MASGMPTVAELQGACNEEEAIAIQAKIEPLVCIPSSSSDEGSGHGGGAAWTCVRKVLALDIAYSTRSNLAVASGVLFQYNDKDDKDEERKGEIVAERLISGQISFPYLAGLLAFREVPLLAEIMNAMQDVLDDDDAVVLLCDGAGIAHPRFCGLACHLGVLYQRPSIGVAKNHLIGTYEEKLLGKERGSDSTLYFQDRTVGSVLRTQSCVRPIFVSPGHCISTQQATKLVLQLSHSFRLPEPLRRADHIGRMELKRLEGQAI